MGTYVKDGNSCIGCDFLEEFPELCKKCDNLKSAITLIKEASAKPTFPVEELTLAIEWQKMVLDCLLDGPDEEQKKTALGYIKTSLLITEKALKKGKE